MLEKLDCPYLEFFKVNAIEQNLPQPFLKAIFVPLWQEQGFKRATPLVRELRHNKMLGKVRFFKFTMVSISVGKVLFNSTH